MLVLVLPPDLYVEWVRFVEPHLPDTLRASPTHQTCRSVPHRVEPPFVTASPMRRAYVWRLIGEYPDQYAAFTALMRMTGKLPS